MKKILLFGILMGISVTLSAQKITLEPGMGLGFGILTSGGSQTDGNDGSMGLALQLGLYYHFNSQFALGFYALAQDQLTVGDLNTPTEVTFFPVDNSTRLLSLNGRYSFNKNEKDSFFFLGLGLGLNRNRRYIRVNDVEKIRNTNISLIPEVGFQAKRLQFVLSFTTPVASPTFDQVGNDDGIRYVMEKGFVSTLQYSLRYQFQLLNKK